MRPLLFLAWGRWAKQLVRDKSFIIPLVAEGKRCRHRAQSRKSSILKLNVFAALCRKKNGAERRTVRLCRTTKFVKPKFHDCAREKCFGFPVLLSKTKVIARF